MTSPLPPPQPTPTVPLPPQLLFPGQAAAEVLAILASLKKAAGVAKPLALGALVFSTAIANVPGMGDAAANWNSITFNLDGGVKYPLRDSMTRWTNDWIADDKGAYDHAV